MSEKSIQILLVEDNPGDARLIREILREAPGLRFDMAVVERLSQALQQLEEKLFDVVLLDLSLPDSQGLDTFDKVYARAPQVPVIVLTGLADETAAVRAVQSGAEDYLVKGRIDSELLARSIRYAIARHEKLRDTLESAGTYQRGQVLGFIGAKGGVGTTTVALNVATILASRRHSVILAELRPFLGTLAAVLRHTPARNLSQLLTLDPAAINQRELAARLATLASGLRVLFGPQTAEDTADITAPQAEAIVEGLASMAEYVVLDLPWIPSEATAAAVRHSDYIGLVLQAEPDSLAAARVTSHFLRAWGVKEEGCGLVVVSKALVGDTLGLKYVSEQLGLRVVGVMAPAADLCLSAQLVGEPLVLHQPDSIAASNLSDLTERIIARRSMGL
ncbi:MAG: response regulator [Armatimonadetes bacterium]|nr:response regulator [Armatimonadota bacterium]